jgi:hypothetical protein
MVHWKRLRLSVSMAVPLSTFTGTLNLLGRPYVMSDTLDVEGRCEDV